MIIELHILIHQPKALTDLSGDLTYGTRAPGPCPQVQAMRSAHLLDGAVCLGAPHPSPQLNTRETLRGNDVIHYKYCQ